MILEGLVTTTDASGQPHLAPMGPTFDDDSRSLLFRPYPTSNTYQNLVRHPYGVFHVTDDACLIAYAAVGASGAPHEFTRAERVDGFRLVDCCRAYEFIVRETDETRERVHMKAEIVHVQTVREFVGFHRARHAVIEAAILATRFHILPASEIEMEFAKLAKIVEKTGGIAERDAMAMLQQRWCEYRP